MPGRAGRAIRRQDLNKIQASVAAVDDDTEVRARPAGRQRWAGPEQQQVLLPVSAVCELGSRGREGAGYHWALTGPVCICILALSKADLVDTRN